MPIAAGVLTPLEEEEEEDVWVGTGSWVGIDIVGDGVWVMMEDPFFFQGALVGWPPLIGLHALDLRNHRSSVLALDRRI